MKIKNIKYIAVIVGFIGLTWSCDSKLDVTNPNQETSSDYWQTEDEIAAGVVGVYNRLILDGSFARTTPVLEDVRGDDCYSESSWTIYPLTGSFTVNSDYDVLEWPWREYYQLISRANNVFYYADQVEFSDEDYKDRLLGQCYFLRALAYFELVENYEKVPLILTKAESEDDYYPETASRDSIFASIVSDLQKAKSMLPTSYDDVSGDDQGQTGRATWGAATAFLGKVYMFEDKYDSAAVNLKEVIDSGIYSLTDDYFDNFTMNDENNSESIFEIQFGDYGSTENWLGTSSSDWKQSSCLDYCYGMTAFGAWGDFMPTDWLRSEYKKERCNDGTLDPRLYYSLVSYEKEYDEYSDGRVNKVFGDAAWSDGTLDTADVYINKYTYARIDGYTAEGDGQSINSTINYRLMRYADVLLLYAEALNEIDGPVADVYTYIQKVRDRVNLPDLATSQPNLTQDEMREQIAHERALEFPYEGIRFFDILRWGWLYDDHLETLKAHDDEFDTWVEGKEWLPIPADELDTNPNLSPNDAN